MVASLLVIGQSEAPQGSEILPRWGKMSVPARNKTRQDPLKELPMPMNA